MADTEPQMEVDQQQEEAVEVVSNAEETASKMLEEAYCPAGSNKLSNQNCCLSVTVSLPNKVVCKIL